jgi:hypothetical protein
MAHYRLVLIVMPWYHGYDDRVASFRQSLAALSRWTEKKESKYLQLTLFDYLLENKLGAALKVFIYPTILSFAYI